jgi:SsrA-binding protein
MSQYRTIATNRRARHEYDILDRIEAGIVLTGTEIKALRANRANIGDAYAKPEGGELWLHNLHISQYAAGNSANHDPTRPRKLLLHKMQIRRLSRDVSEKGFTLVPLRIYLKRHLAKVELALAKGRQRHDKRRAIIDRYREKEAREAIGNRR